MFGVPKHIAHKMVIKYLCLVKDLHQLSKTSILDCSHKTIKNWQKTRKKTGKLLNAARDLL